MMPCYHGGARAVGMWAHGLVVRARLEVIRAQCICERGCVTMDRIKMQHTNQHVVHQPRFE
jgi:hypothetical protein